VASSSTGMWTDPFGTIRSAYGEGRRAALLVAVLLAAGIMAGCLPERFTIDLRPARGELEESVVLEDPGAGAFAPKVALIHLDGFIADAEIPAGLTTTFNPVDEFVARLREAEEDEDVKALVVRINSPGGTVGGSDTIYREIRRFREKTGKPVVVSMGEVAASGGYYAALAADRIVAQPTTITASIGVIIQTFNVSEGLAMIGVDARAITSGPNKDLANPLEPERERHYEILAGVVEEHYQRFRSLVAERRSGISPPRLDELTDGRIVTGQTAAESGLVDQAGGLRDAFASAKELAGLPAARLVVFHPQGLAPRSPYAVRGPVTTPAIVAGGGSSTEINLVQVRMNPWDGALPPGFYYLWRP